MSHKATLTVTSLLSVLFLGLHVTSDFIHNAGELSLQGVLIVSGFLALVLYGTLLLAERKSGYVIIILGGIAALGMPVIHLMSERGVASALNRSSAYFFVFTLQLLGVTGLFSIILSVRGLWSLRRGQLRPPGAALK